MSEIEFLQSGPWLDIATHAPCAIDSGFESVDKLHHLWSPGARWLLTLAECRPRNTYTIRKHATNTEKLPDAARVSRFVAGIDRLGSGH